MLKKAFCYFAFVFMFASQQSFAQDGLQQIKMMEDSLVVIADSMYGAFIPDEREIYNERFVKQLVKALKVPGSYDYPFTALQTKINIIAPDDKSFRIFNWGIAPTDITRKYFGAIQMAGEQLKLFPLVDWSGKMGKGAEDSVLTGGKWFGALYYRIISKEVDGRMVHTMFGLNASSPISNKKFMDPMVITPTGPVFGAPIFNIRSQSNPSARVNRFVMEYKKEVQASLNWDAEMNAVYFDKLVSQVNDPNRKYTYVPSGEYDGFRWNNGYWDYITNLIPIDVRTDGNAPAPAPVKAKEEN